MKNFDLVHNNCILNAKELLAAAKSLNAAKLVRIQFHLGVAAMEELGKLSMLRLKYILDDVKPEHDFSPKVDDHVKKLFWALNFGSFGNGTPKADRFIQSEGLAKMLYDKKLLYQYSDLENSELKEPSQEEVATLLGMVESLIKMQESITLIDPTQEEREELSWFLRAQDEPELRKQMFSRPIFEKIGELGGLRPWLRWLYSEHKKTEQEMIKVAIEEINGSGGSKGNSDDLKWSIKIRLLTDSHFFKSSVFTDFNRKVERIKLHWLQKKQEFDIEFLLPKSINVNRLWDWGLFASQTYTMALNAVTHGRFWYEIPRHKKTFYDSITDLERSGLGVDIVPLQFQFNWGKNVLDEKYAILAMRAYVYFMEKVQTPFFHEALSSYGEGLMLFCKTDIHARFESNSSICFYKAIKNIAKLNGWDGVSDDVAFIMDFASQKLPDPDGFKNLLLTAREVESAGKINKSVSFENVVLLKAYCEAILLFDMGDFERERLKELQQDGTDTPLNDS